MKKLNVCLGQINPTVADVNYNADKIVEIIKKHQDADVIVFPEMSLVGYPLMDHIFDPIIQKKNLKAIERIKNLKSNSTIILGTFTKPPELSRKLQPYYNSAVVIKSNEVIYTENKRLLPNYDVFDERRYFSFDKKFKPININGLKVGILVCEDVWDDTYDIKVTNNMVSNGAEILIVINASPYHIKKIELRHDLIKKKSKMFSVPIVYLNTVGGLDEIVFDGQSFVTNKLGQIIHQAKAFEEDIVEVEINLDDEEPIEYLPPVLDWREEVISALRLNVYDYYHKSGVFNGVVLGLSGGIDSAITSYICAEALGPEKVMNIMMPTKYTSQESIDLARSLCENMGMKYKIHPINNIFKGYQRDLAKNLGGIQFDVADENLQARIRATILMYYSNKYNWLLVSTGNKSEIGVGYCTLYGDTCGGKNIPGDLFKVQIYDICEWINREQEIIPKGIIERPPTAELRENQKDEDSLPPYKILDVILNEIIKYGIGNELEYLKKKGISIDTINYVRKLYLNSEFKRRQLVQSIKVSESAFGIGRRYPVLKKINLDYEF